jgi:hypothetical protein
MEAGSAARSGLLARLRGRVLRPVEGGTPLRQAAPTFAISIAYFYKASIR